MNNSPSNCSDDSLAISPWRAVFGIGAQTTLVLVAGLIFSGCMASTEDPEVIFERGNILSDRGKFDDAVPLYTQVLKTYPEDPEIFFRRGMCYENLGLEEKALADYTSCLELDARHTDAINNKGVVLAKMGRFEESAVEFGKLISQQPDNVLALRNRGLCYHDLAQFDAALADYNAAIKIAADDVHNWFQRGNAYLEQDNYQAAVADFSKAIELDPNFAKAWMNRGVALFSMHDRDAAMKDLEQARQLDENIIIPGIDWKTADEIAELAPVTEITVAKPVLVETQSIWAKCIDLAMTHLKQQAYTDIKMVVELQEQQCARLTSMHEGDEVMIYVCFQSGDANDEIVLPAIGKDDSHRALLVVRQSDNDSSSDEGVEVSRFVPAWKADIETAEPVAVRIKVSE